VPPAQLFCNGPAALLPGQVLLSASRAVLTASRAATEETEFSGNFATDFTDGLRTTFLTKKNRELSTGCTALLGTNTTGQQARLRAVCQF